MSQKKKTKPKTSKHFSKKKVAKLKPKTRLVQRLNPSPVWKTGQELGHASPAALAPFKGPLNAPGSSLVTSFVGSMSKTQTADWYAIAGIVGFILLLAWLGSVVG